MLRLGRRRRRGALRENGSQRHRIRRHAVDLRSLQPDENRPGSDAGPDARNFRGMEQGRIEFLPHRNHPRHLGLQRCRWIGTRGQDPRHRRPEGHGQMDGGILAGPGHSHHADCRGGLCALRFGHEGRARRRREKIERARSPPSRATTRNSSKPSVRRSTRRRLSATRKATCSCARRRRNTNGT